MSLDEDWSPWAPLPIRLSPEVLAETLDGGQSFRWLSQADGSWMGTWQESLARVRGAAAGPAEWSAPPALAERVAEKLRRHLALETDFAALTDSLPWRTDPHLAACIAAFPGLRILRQPFAETLLCFLCSPTKRIIQIKQMVALLAEKHGRRFAAHPRQGAAARGGGGSAPAAAAGRSAAGFRLPTWKEISVLKEADLRQCLLGFRAHHIHAAAQFIAARSGWLEETEHLPYPAAKERLLALPGVGEKVADCVLLFGAGRLEAFPVDVWILKAMTERYRLAGWKPAQVAHFGRAHFGPLAGLAQQYLFAYERLAAKAPDRLGPP